MGINKHKTSDLWAEVTTLLEVARSQYYENAFSEAVQKYQDILGLKILRELEEGTVRCELGYALYGLGEYERAISESLSALELNPAIFKTYGVHNTLGSSYFLAGQYSQAIESHLSALKNSVNDPQKLRSNYQLGRCYLLNGTPEKALDKLKECLELLAEDDIETKLDIQYNLGFTYAQLDKRFNSERAFRILLSEGRGAEDSARGYFGLMQLHIGLEDYSKVIEYGKLTLEHHPDFLERETVLLELRTAVAKAGIDPRSSDAV